MGLIGISTMREIKIPLIEPPTTIQGRFLRIFLLPLLGVGYFLIGITDSLSLHHDNYGLSIFLTPYFFFALALILQGYILNYTDKSNYIVFRKEYIILKKPFRRKKIIPSDHIHDIYLTKENVIIKLYTLEKIEANYFLNFEHIERFKQTVSDYLRTRDSLHSSSSLKYSGV